ncbi:epoxyqueuosine reductase QueH [bacterium]|nr:epoxyqueuosine reductase QueH [bacterium]MBU4133742.1 epoxyqueuosine reductase QueH [bacterium]
MCGVYPTLGREKKITAFFYNPNIHPRDEYISRFMTAGFVSAHFGFNMISDTAFDVEKWAKNVLSQAPRCSACVTDRLMKTAETARAKGFTSFTTTLLVSPYQNHKFIKEEGERISSLAGVDFFYRDFRKNYGDSVRISKELLLYRQKYCGCIFSEAEMLHPPRQSAPGRAESRLPSTSEKKMEPAV